MLVAPAVAIADTVKPLRLEPTGIVTVIVSVFLPVVYPSASVGVTVHVGVAAIPKTLAVTVITTCS